MRSFAIFVAAWPLVEEVADISTPLVRDVAFPFSFLDARFPVPRAVSYAAVPLRKGSARGAEQRACSLCCCLAHTAALLLPPAAAPCRPCCGSMHVQPPLQLHDPQSAQAH